MYRRRTPGIGILLLVAQLFQVGLNYIPPVTLGIIALNTVIYLRLFNGLPSISKACISYHHVWYNDDWKRIILSPFFHLDDLHLYFNMTSLLWKGLSLEPCLGSGGMLYLISVFSVLTGVVLLALDKCLAHVLDDPSYLYTCAAGFSGVLFALKVVTTYQLPPGFSTVMMFRVPQRMACWVELVLIQLLVPAASFTGHLAGIVVGLLYVKGPLKTTMQFFENSFTGYRARPSYTYNSGRSGRRPRQVVPEEEEDEELQAAMRASLRESRRTNSSYANYPRENLEERFSSEEIRRRRLLRFQN